MVVDMVVVGFGAVVVVAVEQVVVEVLVAVVAVVGKMADVGAVLRLAERVDEMVLGVAGRGVVVERVVVEVLFVGWIAAAADADVVAVVAVGWVRWVAAEVTAELELLVGAWCLEAQPVQQGPPSCAHHHCVRRHWEY